MLRGMFKYECNQLHNLLQIYTTTKCLYLSGKDLIDAFKLAPNIKKHTIYSASYRHLYEGQSGLYTKLFEANCNTRFGTCANKVPYLCKFETNWHQF